MDIFTWIIIASVIFSWLYAFNVINSSNQFVNQIGGFLHQITEPAKDDRLSDRIQDRRQHTDRKSRIESLMAASMSSEL